MIQVNRVTRIHRQTSTRKLKVSCCTAGKIIDANRIRGQLMATTVIVSDLEVDRFLCASGIFHRPSYKRAVGRMLQSRMQYFDRLRPNKL